MGDQVERFFVLRKTAYSEADLILRALSPQGEKVSLMARGALRSKKRFGGGVLEPTHLIDAHYQPSRKEGGLHVLKEAYLVDGFSYLRNSYEKLELALFALECVDRVSQEGDQSSQVIYQLLGHLFKSLEQGQELNVLRTQFIVKLLYQQGVLTPEPWMNGFLKTSLHDAATLTSQTENCVQEMLDLQKRAHHYIHTADPGLFFSPNG